MLITVDCEDLVSFETAAQSIHTDIAHIIDKQAVGLDAQMQSLDDCLAHARSQNALHHEVEAKAAQSMHGAVERSYGKMSQYFKTASLGARNLVKEVDVENRNVEMDVDAAKNKLCAPLAELKKSS